MVGVGTATAVPDRLAFEVSVGLTRDDLDLALDETSALMKDVLKALTDNGVAKTDVRTTGLSMNPVYDYLDNSRVFRGYRVSQQLAVEADLDGAGVIVPAIIAAAGNAARVSELRLQVGNPDEVLADARDDAVSQARAKAEEYAAATGQELGEVITLTEVAPDRDRDQIVQRALCLPVRCGQRAAVAADPRGGERPGRPCAGGLAAALTLRCAHSPHNLARMATTNDLKNGMVLNLDGQLWQVIWFQHHKPGKGGAVVRTKLKNVESGKTVDKTFNADVKVDVANVDKRTMQYLYNDGTSYVFMDVQSYDQVEVSPEIVGDASNFMLENQEAIVASNDGRVLYIELPASVEL